MDQKKLDQQSQHWELSFSNKPKMFGSAPSLAAEKALKIFKKENIKNDLFFQLKPSPIFLSEVNNLEILHNRRYQYLSRYNRSNNYNKYISTGAGLYPKISFWCQILKNKDTGIVSETTLKIKKCKD